MLELNLSEAQLAQGMSALRAVAQADGTFEEHERRALTVIGKAVGFRGDLDALPVSSPSAVAEALPREADRTRLVQAMLALSLIDGEIAPEELELLRRYAEALHVEEPRLKTLRQIANGHRKLVYFDMWRRSPMVKDAAGLAWKKKGLSGLWAMFGGLKGMQHDPELAWRYKQLGLLPEGTFGREYWAHMTQRKFSFPGEHEGFPEELAKHDLAHVLGDYNTDPTGECEVVAFISGFMKADPFGYLFQILIHMQLGVHIFDGTPVEHMIVPIERVVAALERGSRVTADLYDVNWDFWADFPLPIAEVRRKYGISPSPAAGLQ